MGRGIRGQGRFGGRGGRRSSYEEEEEGYEKPAALRAWMEVEGTGDGRGEGRGVVPSWKVPKDKVEEEGSIPEWLPQQGGIGAKPVRKRVLPMPEGINMDLKALGISDLEERLKAKFGSPSTQFKDDRDFYDQDDEGYEGEDLVDTEEGPEGRGWGVPGSGGVGTSEEMRALWEEGGGEAAEPSLVDKAEAEAAHGGFRMRPRATETSPGAGRKALGDGKGDAEVSGSEGEGQLGGATTGVSAAGDEGAQGEVADKHKMEVLTTYHSVLSIDNVETVEDQQEVAFRDLGIKDETLLQNIAGLGIRMPTEVQVGAIRALLQEERDVVIHAHTGSGKTLAYLLPLIAQADPDSDALQGVVVAPGRELASQISSVCEALVDGMGLRVVMVIGGANIMRQLEKIKKVKPQIIVATPGRLCELAFDRRRIRLGALKTVVLDEVDALLRAPYDKEIDTIVDATPSGRRQAIFASATGKSPVVAGAVKRYMRENPLFIGSGGVDDRGDGGGRRAQALPRNLRHTILTVPKVKKFETLRRFLNTKPFPESVMIFVNDPYQVDWLTEKLLEIGVVAAPLSGDSSKDDRAEIMRRLQDQRLSMVVTTELAARGVDIAHLTHVVNYDLPTDAEHYVHRAGRCGRAGRPGIVVNIATPDIKFVISKFAQKLGLAFEDAEVKGGEFWLVSRKTVEVQSKTGEKRNNEAAASSVVGMGKGKRKGRKKSKAKAGA